MCYHVYWMGIYIAQFACEAHAQDFQTYNRFCNVTKREEVPDKDLFTERFTTTEIGYILHQRTGHWL